MDRVRDLRAVEKRSEPLIEQFRCLVAIAGYRLKAADHDARLDERNADAFGADFTPEAFSQPMHGEFGGAIDRAERRYVPSHDGADDHDVGG